jgi:hypothetical protein
MMRLLGSRSYPVSSEISGRKLMGVDLLCCIVIVYLTIFNVVKLLILL